MKTISVIACKGNDEIAGMTRKELYFEIVNRLTVDYKMRTGDLMKLYVAEPTMELYTIITICRRMGIKVICYFYDKDTGKYISPKIISYHHDIPQATDGAVFGAIIIEMNPKKLLTQAQDVLKNDYKIEKGDLVNLYITGLTMATVAIINACTMIGANLVCFHFDKDTGKYISQEVL